MRDRELRRVMRRLMWRQIKRTCWLGVARMLARAGMIRTAGTLAGILVLDMARDLDTLSAAYEKNQLWRASRVEA